MSYIEELDGIDADEVEGYLAYREKIRGSNINEQTLLATDYLNHFNEIVMLLEMVPDMPELLEEAKEWKPMGYQDHLLASTFSDKALAADAYDNVPKKYKQPFEQTIGQLDNLIATAIERIEADMEHGDDNLLRENAGALSKVIQRLMDVAGGIIHGSAKVMDQSEIDNLIG